MSDFIKTDVSLPQEGALETWFVEQLQKHGEYLLAFADDGVIWGKLVDGKFTKSHDMDLLVFAQDKQKWTSPELREETLQQVFIFGENSEVRLFKDELGKWKALRVVDGDEPEQVIFESQIVWGDKGAEKLENGFLRVSEFRKGIPDQFLPVKVPMGADQCARLKVHHLIDYDKETGEARIVISRLAGLSIDQRDKKVAK